MSEAKGTTNLGHGLKDCWIRIASNRQVLGRRSQVLADGDDTDANGSQVTKGFNHLFVAFTKTKHEARLSGEALLNRSR